MMEINSISVVKLFYVISLVSLPLSTSALTTFGKTSPQNQNPPPPPTPAMDTVTSRTAFRIRRLTSMGRNGGRPGIKIGGLGPSFGKARECKVEADCTAIQNTTCMVDPRDSRTRCLCGDYTAPINALCTNKYKAVRVPCNDHEECGDKAQCIQANNTMTGKRCQCLEGYYEDNYKCNGSNSLLTNNTVILLSLVLIIKKIVYC